MTIIELLARLIAETALPGATNGPNRARLMALLLEFAAEIKLATTEGEFRP